MISTNNQLESAAWMHKYLARKQPQLTTLGGTVCEVSDARRDLDYHFLLVPVTAWQFECDM